MSEEQHAVAGETEPEAKPAVEESSARDEGEDLDALLNQFDESIKEPAQSTPEPAVDNEILTKVQQLEQQLSDQQFRTDMVKVVETVRGDLDPNVFDDTTIEALIDAEARKQPKLKAAWDNRHNDPSGFNKVVSALGNELNKRFSAMPDAAATEDHEAVANAVRGASNKAPDHNAPPDFSQMTDGEARQAMRKMGIEPQF